MFHTPLCPKNCNIRHHDVVTALQAVAPKFSSSAAILSGPLRVTRGNNKEDFKKHVYKLASKGWSKNNNVPEPSEDLRLPLLHLASIFGKHEIVDWLLNDENYDANLRTEKTNETALHLVARHLYTALSACESRLENMSITAKVANFERIVSLLVEKEVTLFWAKDCLNRDTPFHVLARQLLQAASSDQESETEDLCLSFYIKSVDVFLKLLLAEEPTRLNRRDVKHTLSTKNSEGDTALHLLARAAHQGYLVLRFLVKSLGNNDLLKIKNSAGHSSMDILNQVYPGHERELLIDDEAKKKPRVSSSGTQTTGQKQMDLIQAIQGSNTNATGEPGNTVGGNREHANGPDRCVIHTPPFSGLCSTDCYDIMEAVGTALVNTHTPLCPTGCDLRHHLLTSVVFNATVMCRTYSDDCMPITFKLCIQACFSAGWERDTDVPDPLESLRYPLLHLLCISGNCIAITKLIEEMMFTFSVSRQSKETPLHVAARYFPVTYPEGKYSGTKKIAKFQEILNLIIEQDDDMLFMADKNGDTVLHVLAKCFCATSNLVVKNSGPTSNEKSYLSKQKCYYFKAMELFIDTLADLVSRERVCKKAVCKVIHDGNNATETFWDILQAGPDITMFRVLKVHARRILPFCFGDARSRLVNNLCDSSCPCEGSADLQSRGCQTQPCEIALEGGISVQEPVSSSMSPSVSVEHRELNISKSQPNTTQVNLADSLPIAERVNMSSSDRPNTIQVNSTDSPPLVQRENPPSSATPNTIQINSTNSPPLVQRENTPSSATPNTVQVNSTAPLVQRVNTPSTATLPSSRPQAQVQSIQVQGQAAVTGYPSLQTTAVGHPAPHIPVVFIKEEPVDLPIGTQCFYSVNNHKVGPSQRQNAFIFHPTSTLTTVGSNLSPVSAVGGNIGQHGVPVPQRTTLPFPSASQVISRGPQGHSTAVSNHAMPPQDSQTPFSICNGHDHEEATPVLSGREQTSAVSSHAMAPQSLQTPSSSGNSSQGTTQGTIQNQSGRQVSPQSVEQRGKRKATAEEIASEALKNVNYATYRLDDLHTPLCDASCTIEHQHLILTMYSTSNRKNSAGKNNGFSQYLENTKYNFLYCLKKNLDEGMAKDTDMLDALERLQYPIIHLAAMFYKYCAIEMLALLGFDRNVRSPRTGEFPLHSTLRHNYEVGWKVYKTISQPGFIDMTFSKVFNCLSSGYENLKILSQQDRNGDTPLHVAAKMIVERPAPANSPLIITASEIPDSTQECDTGSSQTRQPSPNPSSSCKLGKATKKHQQRAEFYIRCIGVMCRKIHESGIRNRRLDHDIVKPILLLKNNDGETFLQILCKEHHIAANPISSVLSQFPMDVLNDCAKEWVPKCCWAVCIPSEYLAKKGKGRLVNDVSESESVSCPVAFSETSKRQTDIQPSKPESPKPSSDVRDVQAPRSNTTSTKTDAQGPDTTPIPATPSQNESPGSDMDCILDAVLTPVVSNPTHASLRPNTKRKIIDALKEDYSERLELAVKGRCEVEEDILKHRVKTRQLNEVIAKKKEVMQILERELQELQKEVWHENQAVQALENSLEQFTKEEEEMQKNLAVLQGADLEPPAKRSKNGLEDDTVL